MARSFRLSGESPLQDREFRILFFGRLISMAGSAVAPIALAFAVLELTGSATDLGIVLMSATLPQILFLLVGGIWADRIPRNLVIVGANVVNGVVQVALAGLLLAGAAELWHLAALSAVRGVALAFWFPAQQGLVPQTVRPERLQRANAYLSLSMNTTNVLGAALGGVLVAATSPGVALALDGVSYFASAAVLMFMRLPRARGLEVPRFVAALSEGWREFRGRKWLWVVVSQHAMQNAFVLGAFTVLGPLVAHRYLDGAVSWGFILGAQSLGFVAGGVIAMRHRPARPLLASALVPLPFAAVIASLAAGVPTLAIAAAAVGGGVGFAVSGVLWETTVQQQVPQDRLSRVVSYDALGSFAAIPLGYAIVGPLSDAIGIATTLWLASGILLASIAVQVSVREVRDLRARPDGVAVLAEAPA